MGGQLPCTCQFTALGRSRVATVGAPRRFQTPLPVRYATQVQCVFVQGGLAHRGGSEGVKLLPVSSHAAWLSWLVFAPTGDSQAVIVFGPEMKTTQVRPVRSHDSNELASPPSEHSACSGGRYVLPVRSHCASCSTHKSRRFKVSD